MALSMTTYKGYLKKPYCSMHYPAASFTVVADTPENLRPKQQSQLNSQALYKEDFEKNKGEGFSVVADTPEMQRLKKTQQQMSDIKYQDDFEKSSIRRDAPPPESRQDKVEPPPIPEVFIQPRPTAAAAAAAAAAAPPGGERRFQAVYSYAAADEDEVSLQEGDLLSDVALIDEGWMVGCNQRTGQQGMLPANYVKPV
ncbi:LIM and SH3 domain protein 1-like isoform X2 [Clinocottus analis]